MSTLHTYSMQFNGTSSIRTESNSLGLANSSKITMAARFRINTDNTQQRIFTDTTGRLIIRKNSVSGRFFLAANQTGAVEGATKSFDDTGLIDGEFHNFLWSVDLTQGKGDDDQKVYVDGTRITTFVSEGTADTSSGDITLDMDAQQWIVGGNAVAGDPFDGAIGFAIAHEGNIGDNDDATILATCFDADGNFTDPGLDGTNWFSTPAPVIFRPGVSNRIRNLGNLCGDFNDALGAGEFPILASPVVEARMPVEQAENYVYKAINDISVAPGATTTTISSVAGNFSVYDAVTNQAGLKVGDYITTTNNIGSEFQITSVTTSSIVVAGVMTAYSLSSTEYAAVYRTARRPT